MIEAVAQGNRVAIAVDTYLRTGKMEKPEYAPPYHFPPLTWNMEEYAEAKRPKVPMLELASRKGFVEVERRMKEHVIRDECKRCLRCDLEWQEMREREAAKKKAKAACTCA